MKLNKQQITVLRGLKYQPREERWSHKSLCLLRSLGLVSSESPYSGAIYRWTITDAGRRVLEENGR